jgi:hypothetical protein
MFRFGIGLSAVLSMMSTQPGVAQQTRAGGADLRQVPRAARGPYYRPDAGYP